MNQMNQKETEFSIYRAISETIIKQNAPKFIKLIK